MGSLSYPTNLKLKFCIFMDFRKSDLVLQLFYIEIATKIFLELNLHTNFDVNAKIYSTYSR